MGPEALAAGIVVAALVLYTLTGGADFGGGVLDLLARGKRAHAQREAIAAAIGPIWEPNHVWLILVVVLLFVAFPAAFATISIALHVPLVVLLVGICLRGTAFVFRTYDDQDDDVQRRWSRVFAMGSVVSPVMLGISLGAVASGRIRVDPATGQVVSGYWAPWLAPFPVGVGAFTLALFTSLAAVYILVETEGTEVFEPFRRRAIAAVAATGALAYLCLALAAWQAPAVWDGLTGRWWSLPFQGLTAALGVGTLVALIRRRVLLARSLVVALAVSAELGWAVGQYPWVIPPDLALTDVAAPPEVLWPILGVLAAGSLVLVPSFLWLYGLFKSR